MGIEKPKIFISYRWTDDNYISKVVGYRGIFGTIPLITNYLEIDDFETIK